MRVIYPKYSKSTESSSLNQTSRRPHPIRPIRSQKHGMLIRNIVCSTSLRFTPVTTNSILGYAIIAPQLTFKHKACQLQYTKNESKTSADYLIAVCVGGMYHENPDRVAGRKNRTLSISACSEKLVSPRLRRGYTTFSLLLELDRGNQDPV